jgi:D-3-phosphoglycerate dehydrogenase
LTFRGDIADRDTRLLSAAFCAGLIEQAMDETVNIVNAELLLRDRGIELVCESRSDKGAFSSSVSASVETDATSYSAAGTLFGSDMPRLIRLGEHRLEAYLDGVLLIFCHSDVPGIIGAVGTVFGRHNVNIAQMAVGREAKQAGGKATGVLNLDSPPPEDAMAEMLAHEAIQSAVVVRLPAAGVLPSWL